MQIFHVRHERSTCNNLFVTWMERWMIPPSFLQEFLCEKEIVSRSILESAEEAAKTLRVEDIPEEQCILSPELIAWMKDDDDD